MKKFIISFLILTIVSSVTVSNVRVDNQVFAHTFSGDESATFLALLEMIKTEAHLAQQTVGTNVTLAQQHADATTEHLDSNQMKEISERNKRVANELNDSLAALKNAFNSTTPPTASDISDRVSNLDAILGEVLSVRIDNDQLNNATVKALTINDLVGETLEHYGEAVGHEESNETSESDHNSTTSESTASNSTAQIVNEAPYQTAQALSSRIIELFNDVKSGALNSTAAGSIQTGLESLKSDIDKKASFDTLDHLVDTSITPTLNSAYDLKLKMEEED
ncbi:MAG TPA: hypothetical protein VH415_00575 [Nitrososphaeraceae archaeon]